MAVFLPKGTRDFLPAQMNARLAVIGKLREVFARFGFEPLETPALERIETLTGKYGDEGDKLIFRILKRGEGAERAETDLALRYDLTVPLARVVAMNNDLVMPFKRYQIQPVWRADRPQRGRFREFYQCDCDIVGCHDMSADAECVAVVHESLLALGFTDFTIRLNHRAILRAIVTAAGVPEREGAVLVAVDKLDKIGRDGVSAELLAKGVPQASIDTLWTLFEGRGEAALDHLAEALGDVGAKAIQELRDVLRFARAMGVGDRLSFEPTLARGLDYYTGPVFETVLNDGSVGSVSGGGRYDGLVGMFSEKREVPAVGVALGLERLMVILEERKMLGDVRPTTTALVTVFDESLREASLQAVTALRAAGVPAQITLDAGGKLGKQLKRANELGARFALVIGPDEAKAGTVNLKDLQSGEQHKVPLADAVAHVVALAWWG